MQLYELASFLQFYVMGVSPQYTTFSFVDVISLIECYLVGGGGVAAFLNTM